jgi:SAM-dependent methyltransferase
MNKNQKIPFVSPISQIILIEKEEALVDPISGQNFPILKSIPRFCEIDNYAGSFGFQWNKFGSTQIDTHSGSDQSERRFYITTGWKPEELDFSNVLEVGSGAGRFSEVFLRTTRGILHSIDYSTAVEANAHNNSCYGDRFILAQASIYDIPFPDGIFDRVFCLGVLQHTPSFEKSVQALIRKVRVDGEIVIDFYPIKGWYTKIHSKYILRPLTKILPKTLLLRLIQINIGWMISLFDFLCALRLGVLTRFIPITDIRNFPPDLSSEQRREWAIMDTFDGFSPEFDSPQRVENVVRMFTSYGCDIKKSGLIDYSGGTAMVVRAVKREVINGYVSHPGELAP